MHNSLEHIDTSDKNESYQAIVPCRKLMGSLSLAVVHVTEMPLYYTVAIIGTALRWFLLNVHGNHCVAHEELPTCFR